jgi:16S rRNA (guanine527-N7)-methyltransferase
MTEEEARRWLNDNLDVSRETWERLEAFVAFLRREAEQQNLISAATLDHIWSRHIMDSAQLLRFAPETGSWLDLGSGAGFPGIVIALLSPRPMTLVESRGRRIDYLNRAIRLLDLEDNTIVAGMPLERLQTAPYSVISARAFAPLPKLLDLSQRFSTQKTLWLLPKGKNAVRELHEAHGRWHLDMQIEASVTDAEAGILVGHVIGQRDFAKKTAPGWGQQQGQKPAWKQATGKGRRTR